MIISTVFRGLIDSFRLIVDADDRVECARGGSSTVSTVVNKTHSRQMHRNCLFIRLRVFSLHNLFLKASKLFA